MARLVDVYNSEGILDDAKLFHISQDSARFQTSSFVHFGIKHFWNFGMNSVRDTADRPWVVCLHLV